MNWLNYVPRLRAMVYGGSLDFWALRALGVIKGWNVTDGGRIDRQDGWNSDIDDKIKKWKS